eukprot:59075-Rhodomonas_salina.2
MAHQESSGLTSRRPDVWGWAVAGERMYRGVWERREGGGQGPGDIVSLWDLAGADAVLRHRLSARPSLSCPLAPPPLSPLWLWHHARRCQSCSLSLSLPPSLPHESACRQVAVDLQTSDAVSR